MIQYSRTLVMELKSRGVLDTPLSRGMTAVNVVRAATPPHPDSRYRAKSDLSPQAGRGKESQIF